ncbi:hypothetical protein BaRGS_00001423 [Batillaria attramentaria]|uniref:Cadherin domain-containing protein n=1 Tax=Batillaria attramentaria TaxID=370345 RepID=A0ABD0M6U4_9CAEN
MRVLSSKSNGQVPYYLKSFENNFCLFLFVQYEFILMVQPVNEFAPEFVGAPFIVHIPEVSMSVVIHQLYSVAFGNFGLLPPRWKRVPGERHLPVSTTVMYLRQNATDRDVVSSGSDVSQFDWVYHFWPGIDNKQNGIITITADLDFEALPVPSGMPLPFFIFNLTVTDTGGLNSTNSTVFYIVDIDDQPPEFFYPGCTSPCIGFYTADVSSNQTGVLTGIQPARIRARDKDTLNKPVRYSISGGPPYYRDYLSIDGETGQVTILKPLGDFNEEQLIFQIKAKKLASSTPAEQATLMLKVAFPGGGPTSKPDTQTNGSMDSVVIAVVALSVIVFLAFVALAGLVTRPDDTADSGNGSINGTVIPTSPHAGSVAPTYTRMVMPNGQVFIVPVKGMRGKARRKQRAPGDNSPGIEESAEEGGGEGNRRMSMQDRVSMQDIDARGGLALASPPHIGNGGVPRAGVPAVSGGVPMPYPQPQMMPNGGTPNGQVPRPVRLPNGQVVMATLDAHGNPILHRQLPPMSAPGANGGEVKLSKKKRKKLSYSVVLLLCCSLLLLLLFFCYARFPLSTRMVTTPLPIPLWFQEAAMIAQQEYDGTKPPTEESSDSSLYTQGGKQKVKLSTRKKNIDPIDPKHRLEVEEGDAEQE